MDKYGNPVMFTYNGKSSFPSFCGGIATIFTVFLIFYWWIITLVNHLHNPYRRYTLAQQQYLTSPANQERPIYTIDENQLMIVY